MAEKLYRDISWVIDEMYISYKNDPQARRNRHIRRIYSRIQAQLKSLQPFEVERIIKQITDLFGVSHERLIEILDLK